MSKKVNCNDMFVVTLTRHSVGEFECCSVNILVESLNVEVHKLNEAVRKVFCDATVNFPSVGKASLDVMAPRGIDNKLAEGIAENIKAVLAESGAL